MKAVFFDWDGTIVDSIDRLFDAYALVCARYGLAFDRPTFRRVFAPDWRLMYRRMGMPEHSIEEAGKAWVEAFEGDRVALFPGVHEGLERLVAAGFELGLVTGGHREIIQPQLERHAVDDLFAVRVFGNDLKVGKPDPAPLLLAIDRLQERRPLSAPGAGQPPLDRSVAYVGDALDDMRMAAAAGVHGVGIPSILCDSVELEAAGAAEVAASVAEWVDRLLARPAERV